MSAETRNSRKNGARRVKAVALAALLLAAGAAAADGKRAVQSIRAA